VFVLALVLTILLLIESVPSALAGLTRAKAGLTRPRQRGVSRKARAPARQTACRSSAFGLPPASMRTLL
jgi:hypothetical protein